MLSKHFKLFERAESSYKSLASSASFLQQQNEATIEPADVPQMASGSKRASCNARTTPKWYVPNAPPPLKANAVAPYASLATPKRLRQTFVRSSSLQEDESQSTDAATCVRASVAARSEPARNRKRDHPLHQKMETSRVDGVSARLKRLSTPRYALRPRNQ